MTILQLNYCVYVCAIRVCYTCACVCMYICMCDVRMYVHDVCAHRPVGVHICVCV